MVISFGHGELDGNRMVKAGDTIRHNCGETHILRAAENNGKPDESLLWFKCGEKTMIGALDRRLIFKEEEQ